MVGFLERCFPAFGLCSPALRCIFPLRSKDAASIGFKLLQPVQCTCFVNPIAAEILFVWTVRFSINVDKKIVAESGSTDDRKVVFAFRKL